MTNVLITGACGRIGSHVIRQLLGEPVRVVGIDSVMHYGNLGELAGQVTVLPLDIQDLGALVNLMTKEKITNVIHLAAALGQQYDAQPWGSYQVNLGGTLNVLEAARYAKVSRVVSASTHDIYPKASGPYGPPEWRPIAEDHPPDPRRPYPVMKLAAEYMGRYYAQNLGVDYAAVRFSTYYSAERALQRGHKPHDLVSRLILDAVEGNASVIESGGEYVFDPIYIKDCAYGVLCASRATSSLDGAVYNIGGGVRVSLRDVADVVRRVLPSARIEIGPGDLPDPERQGHHAWLDISRAKREIGYEPQFTLARGVIDCARELQSLLRLRRSAAAV